MPAINTNCGPSRCSALLSTKVLELVPAVRMAFRSTTGECCQWRGWGCPAEPSPMAEPGWTCPPGGLLLGLSATPPPLGPGWLFAASQSLLVLPQSVKANRSGRSGCNHNQCGLPVRWLFIALHPSASAKPLVTPWCMSQEAALVPLGCRHAQIVLWLQPEGTRGVSVCRAVLGRTQLLPIRAGTGRGSATLDKRVFSSEPAR